MPAWGDVLHLVGTEPPPLVREAIGPYFDSIRLLGERTAEMHLALAAGTSDAFRPEPFTTLYQRSLLQSMRTQLRPTLTMLRRALSTLDDNGQRGRAARARRRGQAPRRVLGPHQAPHRHPPDPGARRLPPRSGAARRPRLRDHRLRGRAVSCAHRTTDQEDRTGRRGGHAALLPVRGARRPPGPCRPRPRAHRAVAGLRAARAAVAAVDHHRLPHRATSTSPAARRSSPTIPPTCSRCSARTRSTRRSTRCATTSRTDRDWAPIPLHGIVQLLASV